MLGARQAPKERKLIMATPTTNPRKNLDHKEAGPSFSSAGAVPGGSEAAWTSAYPAADATRPETLPEAIAVTMTTDRKVEALPVIERTSQGPTMSTAGAMPVGSETAWGTAYPSADATRPRTMPRGAVATATSGSVTKEQLYSQACHEGIRGRSSMTKAQLQHALSG